jgi:hypothetical protein
MGLSVLSSVNYTQSSDGSLLLDGVQFEGSYSLARIVITNISIGYSEDQVFQNGGWCYFQAFT